jgi:hypothetical protein
MQKIKAEHAPNEPKFLVAYETMPIDITTQNETPNKTFLKNREHMKINPTTVSSIIFSIVYAFKSVANLKKACISKAAPNKINAISVIIEKLDCSFFIFKININ